MNDLPVQSESVQPKIGPLLEVWRVAWPTVVSMTSYTVMTFIDKLMIGQVGATEVAAQGNGGIWAFSPIAITFGVLTVVNTYVSQNLGAGRPEEGPKYAWAAIWMSMALWAGILLPWAFMLPFLFSWMGHTGDLYQFETHYGQILLFGAFALLMARSIHQYFFGLHRPKVITVSMICGNAVNIFGNYALIFGSDGIPGWGLPGIPGAPAWGIYGAAIATVAGTLVELIIPLAIFLGPKMNAELRSRSAWRPDLKPIRDLIKIGWPASVQFGNEMFCWSIFMSLLVGMFGQEHMTAGWIALNYMHLSFMPALGFMYATTSLVGKYIGAGQPDVAVSRARIALALAVTYMTICGALFFIFRYPLIDFFLGEQNISAEEHQAILAIGAKLLICAAVFQTFDAFGIVYSGGLRGAGDTIWPAIMTMIYSWTLIVAGGWLITQLWPEIESVGPWIGAAVYIIVFGATMAIRFERGHWRSIKLLDTTRRDAARVAPVSPGPPPSTPDSAVRDIVETFAEASE